MFTVGLNIDTRAYFSNDNYCNYFHIAGIKSFSDALVTYCHGSKFLIYFNWRVDGKSILLYTIRVTFESERKRTRSKITDRDRPNHGRRLACAFHELLKRERVGAAVMREHGINIIAGNGRAGKNASFDFEGNVGAWNEEEEGMRSPLQRQHNGRDFTEGQVATGINE